MERFPLGLHLGSIVRCSILVVTRPSHHVVVFFSARENGPGMIEAPGDVDALKNFQPIRTQFDKYLPKSFRGDLVVCGSDPSHCDAVKDK